VPVFLTAKDQDLSLRDGTSAKPVLDVVLEALGPDFDEFPIWRFLARIRVQSLNVRHRRLIATQHIDEAVLDGYGRRQVPIPVELWLLTPLITYDRVDLTCLAGVVEA